jgi:hypothetical protein
MPLIFRAGAPTIMMSGSEKDFVTTEFAPIAMLSAIVIRPNMTTPGPM